MHDDDIDTSEIPELDQSFFESANLTKAGESLIDQTRARDRVPEVLIVTTIVYLGIIAGGLYYGLAVRETPLLTIAAIGGIGILINVVLLGWYRWTKDTHYLNKRHES